MTTSIWTAQTNYCKWTRSYHWWVVFEPIRSWSVLITVFRQGYQTRGDEETLKSMALSTNTTPMFLIGPREQFHRSVSHKHFHISSSDLRSWRLCRSHSSDSLRSSTMFRKHRWSESLKTLYLEKKKKKQKRVKEPKAFLPQSIILNLILWLTYCVCSATIRSGQIADYWSSRIPDPSHFWTQQC